MRTYPYLSKLTLILLAVSGYTASKFFLVPSDPALGNANINGTISMFSTASDSSTTDSTPNLLHCYRESALQDRVPYDLLITGCGHSGTGFFSKVLSSAGCELGHEEMKRHGTSAWIALSKQNGKVLPPFSYKHVFLVVRHPLKVLNSYYGTAYGKGWDFYFSNIYVGNETISSRETFDSMQKDFQALEWWNSYTLKGENAAECWMRTEDANATLMHQVCERAQLGQCNQDWHSHIEKHTGYNKHNQNKSEVSWEILEEKARTEAERRVLSQARALCKRYHYSKC